MPLDRTTCTLMLSAFAIISFTPQSFAITAEVKPHEVTIFPAVKAKEAAVPEAQPVEVTVFPAVKPEVKPLSVTVYPAVPVPQPEQKAASLKIGSWGGAYVESQKLALFAPFKAETGTAIDVALHHSAETLENATLPYDVTDLPPAMVEAACAKGLLLPLDVAKLPAGADGTAAADDFLPGAITRCGVGSVAWSTVIVADKATFKNPPSRVADFFNLQKFPGKRGLPRSPRYVLELALLADGVPAAEVYATLATPEGLVRAAKKLTPLRKKNAILWWSTPKQSLQIIKDQTAAMALTYSGRAFQEVATDAQRLNISFDGAIYDVDMWAISAKTKFPKQAAEFIAFATKTDRLAEQIRWFPYGPLRKSAVAIAGNHQTLGLELAGFLPTAQSNFSSALKFDAAWWTVHEAEIGEKFNRFVETGFLEPPPVKPAKQAKKKK